MPEAGAVQGAAALVKEQLVCEIVVEKSCWILIYMAIG